MHSWGVAKSAGDVDVNKHLNEDFSFLVQLSEFGLSEGATKSLFACSRLSIRSKYNATINLLR